MTEDEYDQHWRASRAAYHLRLVTLDVIRAMTDEQLADFRDALSGPWMMTKSDLYRRADIARADTQWPDAPERVA